MRQIKGKNIYQKDADIMSINSMVVSHHVQLTVLKLIEMRILTFSFLIEELYFS